jgi:hypothetical protein
MKHDQRRFAEYLIEQLEECIEDGCVDSVACLLDNLAQCGLKLSRDGNGEVTEAYREELMELAGL